MGFFTGVLTLPLAPLRGTVWVAERLLEEAERELNDPALVEQELLEAESRHARGELSDDEYERLEDELMRRLIGPGS